jgi:hypothetical protein
MIFDKPNEDDPPFDYMFYYAEKGSDWTIEEIGSFFDPLAISGASRLSLAFKSDGTPCLAFFVTDDWGAAEEWINYACRTSPGNWTVDEYIAGSDGATNEGPISLAFDDEDTPYVLYAVPSIDNIRLSFKNGSWDYVDIDTAGWDAPAPTGNDLVFGPDGLCAVYGLSEPPHEIRYNCQSTGWTPETAYASEFDIDNANPFLFYYEDKPYIIFLKNNQVWVAWFEENNGPGWLAEYLYDVPNPEVSAAMQGHYIWTASLGTLWAVGPGWARPWNDPNEVTEIDDFSGSGILPHIAFDANGQGKVVYTVIENFDPPATTFIAYGEETDSWDLAELNYARNKITGLGLDVVWDENTNPHYSYWQAEGVIFPPLINKGDLYYSYFDEDSDNWVDELILYEDYPGFNTAIALDSQGEPCIVFVEKDDSDHQYGDLYFVCRSNGVWSPPDLIASVRNETLPSLVIKDDSTACVSYSEWPSEYITVKCQGNSWDTIFQSEPGQSASLNLDNTGELILAFEANGYTKFITEEEMQKTLPEPEIVFPYYNQISLAMGSEPHIIATDGTFFYHATKYMDGNWHWEMINADLGGNDLFPIQQAGLGMKGNAPQIAAYVPADSLYHLSMIDADGDGTPDENDPFIAPGFISGYPVYVEGYPNTFQLIEGEHEVTFGPVSFEWDFDSEQLDLSAALVNEGDDYIEVHGIYEEIPDGKTVRIPKGKYGYACILDEPGAAVVNMTRFCCSIRRYSW